MMNGQDIGTQPVLVLLTDSASQDNMIGITKHHGSREFQINREHNSSSMDSHYSQFSANCVLSTISEPSGSNRTSLEALTDGSVPNSATATNAASRKSVSFEEDPRPWSAGRLGAASSHGDRSPEVSPFSSYANLASFDNCNRRCSEEGGNGSSRFPNSGKKCRHQPQTEHQCMLGVDSQATSAPMGTLDDASAAASTAETLRIIQNAMTDNQNASRQQQQPQTAAQRLRSQSSNLKISNGFHISSGRNESVPLPEKERTTLSYFQQDDGEEKVPVPTTTLSMGAAVADNDTTTSNLTTVSSSPPPAPSPDLLRDFGEAYGAHYIAPRHSIDHTSSSASISTTSSASNLAIHQHHNSNHNLRHSLSSGSGVGSIHPSHSNNTINSSGGGGPTNRSSFDVLLGTSANSTPSRQSLDLLQDLLAAVGATGSGSGPSSAGSRHSLDSFGSTGTPRSSAPGAFYSHGVGGAATTGGKKNAAQRLSAAGHLENARLAMTMSSLSLDPIGITSTSNNTAAIMEHRYPSTSEILTPSALRALADSSMSVTVVAAPMKRSAPTAAGPSVGAMASGLIDHYIPIPGSGGGTAAGGAGGESSSTPPRHGSSGNGVSVLKSSGGSGGGNGGYTYPAHVVNTTTTTAAVSGSNISAAATTTTSTRIPGVTATRLQQQSSYTQPGHVAPPALLDADLHDTFGAHAWYCGPTMYSNTRSNSRRVVGSSNVGVPGAQNTSSGRYAVNSNSRTPTTPFVEKKSGGGGGGSNGSSSGEQTPVGSQGRGRGECIGGQRYSGGMAAAVAANDSSSEFSAAGTVLAGQQQQSQRHLGGNRGTAKHLELTSMPGQHSVTLHDAQCIVPSYDFLRQRRLAKAQQAKEGDEYWSGGYIAEAKRVLNEAMGAASRQEAENRDSSYSGAIGPLLRHLTAAAGDDEKSRSALHTLGLLVSNLPNRGIIAELQGRHTLASVLRLCKALDVREQAVTLLWDLDSSAGKDAAPAFCAEDLFALIQLLEETQHAAVASSALHFLDAAIELPTTETTERVALSPEQLNEMATRVVKEVCAHKHRLQDAAQYTLGALLGAVLSDPMMTQHAVSEALKSLLAAVSTCKDPDQCQVLLTVLSSLAGKPRLLSLLAKGTRARDAVLQCGQNAGDQRVKARSLSLIKVLRSKDEQPAALSSSWYFGPEDDGITAIPDLE